MTRTKLFAFILGCALATTALARDLPDYYPKNGFGRAGQIDAVHLDEDRVVIDDIPYQISATVVVHSLSSYSVPKTRLRPGIKVAFKVGGGRAITELWLLPQGYDVTRRR